MSQAEILGQCLEIGKGVRRITVKVNKKNNVFVQLNSNMEEYRKDYQGFVRRSERIEEREYKERGREDMDLEILNSYGAL